jgi:hypothetical protein
MNLPSVGDTNQVFSESATIWAQRLEQLASTGWGDDAISLQAQTLGCSVLIVETGLHRLEHPHWDCEVWFDEATRSGPRLWVELCALEASPLGALQQWHRRRRREFEQACQQQRRALERAFGTALLAEYHEYPTSTGTGHTGLWVWQRRSGALHLSREAASLGVESLLRLALVG